MSRGTLAALGLVRAALDLPVAQRSAWLDAQCNGDAILRTTVDALLADAGDEAECPLGEGDDPADTAPDPLVGTRLGTFRLHERIGRGGMGVVYRAEREDADFHQEVAVKLIRRGFDFDDVQARFRRERRILARLSHPHLAHFVDGGVAADGRPWFALEFVRGEPVTDWCDARRLGLDARVAVFLDVCAAVQYAHRELVVHRDLKPANILVDTAGAVRLLDFGIARLLEGDEDAAAATELGGRRALTAQYAAPERFGDGAGGVAADIYSLGLVLYELACGSLPYRVPRGDVLAAQRIVQGAVFVAPSQALADQGEAVCAQRAAARQGSPRALRARLRGDLSRVLRKALAADPAQRYATVQAFAADLQRWRDGRSLELPGSRYGYRAALFLRRHRVAVALAAAIALALAGGVAAALLQARRAELASQRSAAVQDYLVGLFENAVPGAAADQVPDTRELLARGVRRARSELAATPLLQADLLGVLGRIHVQLGLYDEAEPLLNDAIAAYERHAPDNVGALADCLLELARVQRQRNRYDAAQAALQRGLANVAGRDAAREAQLRNLLGVVLALRREVDAGIKELQQALRLQREREQPPGNAVAIVLNDLGYVLDANGRSAESLDYFFEALALKRRLYGTVHAELAYPLNNIAEALRKLGRLDEAEPYSAEAVAIDAQIYTTPNSTHARHLGNYALIAIQRGDGAAAETALRQALAIRESIYRADDTQIGFTLTNLAAALNQIPRADEAERIATRAIAIFDQARGDWRPVLSAALQNRALARRNLGHADAALADAQRALTLVREARGEASFETLRAHAAVAKALLAAGRRDEGAPLLRETLQRTIAQQPPASRLERLEREAEVGALDLSSGDDAAARQHLQTALGLAEGLLAATHPTLIDVRLGLAELQLRSGDEAAARAQAEALRAVLQARDAGDVQRRRWQALPGAR
ncbi:tetratricopeptide repeat protein [Tahibacter sp. UC22_41]|uniref:serine/threonine-protein kinase n=1 Tax=Tahibacter sp. UC22_41 TaxID=3350178 RepID=UPI0036DC7355